MSCNPTELPLSGESLLGTALRASERRPRAAILVMIYEDETDVGLHLPDDPAGAVAALKCLKRATAEAVDCLLRPAKHNA